MTCTRSWQVVRNNHSCSHQQSWTDPRLLRKRAPISIHSTPADRSTGPYPISLPSQHWSSGEKSNICWQSATSVYWAHISSMWSVCSILYRRGANSSILNWHRRGLQPWRSQLSALLSPPFPIEGLPLSLNGPVRSQVNIFKINLQQLSVQHPSSRVASMRPDHVMVYGNNLEYEWSWDRENDSNTRNARILRQVQAS
jgi:hypothetical protein